MNFISHLAIARRYSTDSAFGLGAMLPDLVTMAGARMPAQLPETAAATLRQGVALHHRTDDTFHSNAGFLRLMARCAAALTDRGLARGPARAAAHVGVELLLDGELGDDDALVAAYLAALSVPASIFSPLLANSAGSDALQHLLMRLKTHGFPFDYGDAAVVSRRIVGMLAARPRLRIAPENAGALAEVLAELQPEVRDRCPELFAAVHAALSVRSLGHNEG